MFFSLVNSPKRVVKKEELLQKALDKRKNYAIIISVPHESVRTVGVDWSGGPPVPIPNTEVKPGAAEDSCRVTDRKNR